jgi:hypothetical protein
MSRDIVDLMGFPSTAARPWVGRALFSQGCDPARQEIEGFIPCNANELSGTSRTYPLHRSGETDTLVVKQLKPTHPQWAKSTGIDRIVGTAFNFYGPIVYFSNLYAATTRTESAYGFHVGKFTNRRNWNPGPVLSPYGDIVREFPGERGQLDTCCSPHDKFNEIPSVQFHFTSIAAFDSHFIIMLMSHQLLSYL